MNYLTPKEQSEPTYFWLCYSKMHIVAIVRFQGDLAVESWSKILLVWQKMVRVNLLSFVPLWGKLFSGRIVSETGAQTKIWLYLGVSSKLSRSAHCFIFYRVSKNTVRQGVTFLRERTLIRWLIKASWHKETTLLSAQTGHVLLALT